MALKTVPHLCYLSLSLGSFKVFSLSGFHQLSNHTADTDATANLIAVGGVQ